MANEGCPRFTSGVIQSRWSKRLATVNVPEKENKKSNADRGRGDPWGVCRRRGVHTLYVCLQKIDKFNFADQLAGELIAQRFSKQTAVTGRCLSPPRFRRLFVLRVVGWVHEHGHQFRFKAIQNHTYLYDKPSPGGLLTGQSYMMP